MTGYLLSYWVRIEGGPWQRVVQVVPAGSQEAAKAYAMGKTFPAGSVFHQLELVPSKTPKAPKRKAAWKQNPLARFA